MRKKLWNVYDRTRKKNHTLRYWGVSKLIVASVIAAAAFSGIEKDFDSRIKESPEFHSFTQKIISAESLGQVSENTYPEYEKQNSLLINSKSVQSLLDDYCKPFSTNGESKLICDYGKKHDPDIKATTNQGIMWEIGQKQGYPVYISSGQDNAIGIINFKDSKKLEYSLKIDS